MKRAAILAVLTIATIVGLDVGAAQADGTNVIHQAPNVIVASAPVSSEADGLAVAPNADFDAVLTPPALDAVPARRAPEPYAVQGPGADGGSGNLSDDGATGPLNVTAWLGSDSCSGGPVLVTAVVSDDDGNAVAGATVSGLVQFADSTHSLTFPATVADGSTSMSFNSGNPHGGYRVRYTMTATGQDEEANDTASTTISCYAP